MVSLAYTNAPTGATNGSMLAQANPIERIVHNLNTIHQVTCVSCFLSTELHFLQMTPHIQKINEQNQRRQALRQRYHYNRFEKYHYNR